MKYARITGNVLHYYAKPRSTAYKKYREPIVVGERTCMCRLTAWVRKKLYELI